jgi:YidC/Oxa1 family membrane protein insertase
MEPRSAVGEFDRTTGDYTLTTTSQNPHVIRLLMGAHVLHLPESKLRVFAPKLKEIQEKYKDDKLRLQQEMMAIYKTEKVNPLAGCLPVLLQIPIFYALYKTLLVSIEMRHQQFLEVLAVLPFVRIFEQLGQPVAVRDGPAAALNLRQQRREARGLLRDAREQERVLPVALGDVLADIAR